MSGKLSGYYGARRDVRRAKRYAATDRNYRKRKLFTAALIGLAICFVLAELVGLYFTKRSFDKNRSEELSSQLVSNLAIMSTAMQSGDQVSYDKNFAAFRNNLAEYAANSYVKTDEAATLVELSAYETTLLDNSDTVRELSQLHLMLTQLGVAIDSQNDLAADFSAYRQNLAKLESGVGQIKSDELKSTREALLETIKELDLQLESLAQCVDVCQRAVIEDRQKLFKKTIEERSAKLDELNIALAERYSPLRYILLLQ